VGWGGVAQSNWPSRCMIRLYADILSERTAGNTSVDMAAMHAVLRLAVGMLSHGIDSD
jgi:hypothetical protein